MGSAKTDFFNTDFKMNKLLFVNKFMDGCLKCTSCRKYKPTKLGNTIFYNCENISGSYSTPNVLGEVNKSLNLLLFFL